MVYVSLLGILLAITLFIILCYRGIPVTVSALLLSFLVWLFSVGCADALSFDEVAALFASGATNIIGKYLLLFMFSALFGSLVTYTGIASALGRAYERLVLKAPKKVQKLLAVALVPFLNAVFVYAGISVYVAVFAVMAVAKDLFKRMDLPWHLYSLSIVGSGTFASMALPGSASITNLTPIPYTGTTAAPAPVFSIIISIECLVLGVLYMQYAIRRAERKNEGFLPSGAEIDKAAVYEERDLPPVFLPLALALMALPVVLMNIFKFSIVSALFLSDIVFLAVYHRRLTLESGKTAIVSGLVSGIGPTMTFALMSGFAYVLLQTPGFQLVFRMLLAMPIISYLKIVGMVGVVGFLMGNYNATVPASMEMLGHDFLATCGVPMGIVHRLISISSLFAISPHNSALCNSLSVVKLNHKQTYFNYFMLGPVLGVVLVISAVILINLGIVY